MNFYGGTIQNKFKTLNYNNYLTFQHNSNKNTQLFRRLQWSNFEKLELFS